MPSSIFCFTYLRNYLPYFTVESLHHMVLGKGESISLPESSESISLRCASLIAIYALHTPGKFHNAVASSPSFLRFNSLSFPKVKNIRDYYTLSPTNKSIHPPTTGVVVVYFLPFYAPIDWADRLSDIGSC